MSPLSTGRIERHLLLRHADPDAAGQHRVEVRYSAAPEGTPDDVVTLSTVPCNVRQRVAATMLLLEQRLLGQTDEPVTPMRLWTLGTDLAETALPELVERQLQADLAEATRTGRRVRLWVDDHGSAVSGWPWEYLCFLPGASYLVLHPACSVVRSCRWSRQEPRPAGASTVPPASQSLEALIVWADPQQDYPPLYAETQVRMVQGFFERGDRNCRVLWPCRYHDDPSRWATRANLERELQKCPPHLVYFVCHGEFDEVRKQGFVVLEGPGGSGYEKVQADQLAALFPARGGPQVVFLEACRSGSRGADGCGLSVADALAVAGRIVLGMQFLWPAPASPPFWTTLFGALLVPSPPPIDDAVFAARELLAGIHDPYYWGIPVLYRPAPHLLARQPRPQARPAVALVDQAIRELEAAIGLNGIRQQLIGLRDGLVRRLKDLQQTETMTSDDVQEVLVESDPFYALLAGDSDQAAVESSPLWFTQLLEPPAELSWQPGDEAGPWRVRLRDAARDVFVAETARPAVALPAERIPRGINLAWEVRPLSALDEAPLVQGVFRVLSTTETAAARMQLTELEQLPEGPAHILALADGYNQHQLYDDLVRFLRQQVADHPDGPLGYAIRRVLAGAYVAVSRELAQRYPRGIAEVEWAAQRAQEFVVESCRVLGL